MCPKCDSAPIYKEARFYNDIVMFNFLDSYLNLTTKTLVSLNWAVNTYNTQIFIKNDDDVIPNVHSIYQRFTPLVETKPNGAPAQQVILGHCFTDALPVRGHRHKFSVSQNIYPKKKYPVYCNGPNYVISKAAIFCVLNQSLSAKLLSLEDVSLGILAEKAGNVNVINIPHWMFTSLKPINVSQHAHMYRKYYSIHTKQMTPVDMETLWYKYHKLLFYFKEKGWKISSVDG